MADKINLRFGEAVVIGHGDVSVTVYSEGGLNIDHDSFRRTVRPPNKWWQGSYLGTAFTVDITSCGNPGWSESMDSVSSVVKQRILGMILTTGFESGSNIGNIT